MSQAHHHDHPAIAAYVGERAITVQEVDERVEALRRGPLADRLPHPGSADGRNLRRWVVQLITHEALIEADAPAGATASPQADAGSFGLAAALRMGGVAAALLARMPAAREAWERVAAQVPVPNGEDYYARNRDLYAEPYEEVREKIERELWRAAADRAFTSWLDRRHAALVRLMPGFEHPADPRHPDATHRH